MRAYANRNSATGPGFLRALTLPALLLGLVLVAGCSRPGNTPGAGPQIAVAAPQFETRDNRLILNGDITRHTAVQFAEIMRESPGLDTLVLGHVPGSVDDAAGFALGRLVRAQNMRTHLTSKSEITAGGVTLFLAGLRRTMERGARIGDYFPAGASGDGRDADPESAKHDPYIFYTEDMLGTAEFYWFTPEAATADRIHWMSEAEILRFGLITSAVMEAQPNI